VGEAKKTSDSALAAKETPTAASKRVSLPGPVMAMREHWESIRSRKLETAYSRFAAQYTRQTTFAEWSRSQKDYDPDISIASIKLDKELPAGKAVVRLSIVTRDRGSKGDASRCNIFQGRVLLRRQGGRWLYDPTGLPKGSFGPERPGGVRPSADKRCDGLF